MRQSQSLIMESLVLVHYLICTNLFQARARVGLGDKKSEDYETLTNQSR